MNNRPRILVLTASYGDGHLKAAQALKQAFHQQGVPDVHVVDLMKEAHPFLNTITTSLYLKSAKVSSFGIDYYGWSYYMTRNTKPDFVGNRYFNILGKKKLKEKIEQVQPDAIVSTFPFGAAPALCADIGIPNFTVITDFALHGRWLHPATDKYYVATEDLRQQVIKQGPCRPSSVAVTGIPIRRAFVDPIPLQSPAENGKGAGGRKTVLVLAGSHGVLGGMADLIRSLIDGSDCCVNVVCGRNRKLETKLRQQFVDEPDVRIFGFVEQIHELMAASSCIVTKAGGITLAEALALRTPLFLFKPFAGQEKENAVYLSEKGAAFIAHHTEELSDHIRRFLTDETFREKMKNSIVPLQKRAAADSIARDVIHSVRQTVPT